MTTDVVMPQMGESVTEGTIVNWYKKAGDWVEKDETLLLIATDKVDAEVPSPASGYLQELRYPENETVPIDTVIAVLSKEKGEAKASPTKAPVAPAEEPEAEAPPKPAPALRAVETA